MTSDQGPDPHDVWYFAWALDDPKDLHPEETAAAAFMRRYSRPPEFIRDGLGNNLLLGPVER